MAEPKSSVVEKAAEALKPRPAPPKVEKPKNIIVHILSKGAALCDEFSKIRVYPFREGHDYTGFENYKANAAKPTSVDNQSKPFELCAECKARADQYLKK